MGGTSKACSDGLPSCFATENGFMRALAGWTQHSDLDGSVRKQQMLTVKLVVWQHRVSGERLDCAGVLIFCY